MTDNAERIWAWALDDGFKLEKIWSSRKNHLNNGTQYIRADLLEWKDTRKGELPGPDDFPVLIKDDFESAFNLPARILVNDGTRADWHSNYPFWRRILEVDA